MYTPPAAGMTPMTPPTYVEGMGGYPVTNQRVLIPANNEDLIRSIRSIFQNVVIRKEALEREVKSLNEILAVIGEGMASIQPLYLGTEPPKPKHVENGKKEAQTVEKENSHDSQGLTGWIGKNKWGVLTGVGLGWSSLIAFVAILNRQN